MVLPIADHASPGPPAVIVAGCHSGVGKTSIAVGIMAALRKKGLRVQPFKVGPDFLDPMHHVAACGLPSFNLDGWILGHEGCKATFLRAFNDGGADIAVIEGVMGLHDGLDGKSDAGSTAEIAKWLDAPVLLVVDAWCLSRSAAAMVLGYVTFDPAVRICGVIFNRVAGESHATWLREAMQSAPAVASVPVLGCVPKDKRVEIQERHLGLHMPQQASLHIQELGMLVSAHVDMDNLQKVASSSQLASSNPASRTVSNRMGPHGGYGQTETKINSLPQLGTNERNTGSKEHLLPPVRIGVARDAAFCFYYEDNLTLLRDAGATLVPFSPLTDTQLPQDLEGIYFGGGYPELHAPQLESNLQMRSAVKAFCKEGGLCWAECGGLMYLAQTMGVRPEDNPQALPGQRFEMAGVLPFDVDMSKRMVMGYCTAKPTPAMAALFRLPQGLELRCQQFHFSEITLNGEPAEKVDGKGQGCGINGIDFAAYAVRMERPGAVFAPEGVIQDSTLASYCHVHFGATPGLAEAIVAAARSKLTVASLLPSGTEAFCAISGGSKRLLAVSTFCDYPREVCSLRKATRSLVQTDGRTCEEVEAQIQKLLAEGVVDFHPVDVDFLQTQRPGIVLSQDSCPTCSAETSVVGRALVAAGLETRRNLCVQASNVDEILNSVEIIGAAAGELTAARSIRCQLEQRLEEVSSAIGSRPRPRVLGLECVCPLVASGQWLPDMRLRAGAEDALGDSPGAAPRRLTWDEVRESHPDVIIILCCGKSAQDAAAESALHLITQTGFADLPALKARPPRLYFIGHELCSRPSLRVVEGIQQLAALIHPVCFPVENARDALQLKLNEDEDIPAQDKFVSRCEPLCPSWNDEAQCHQSCSSSWLMVKTSGRPSQGAVSVILGRHDHDAALVLPGSHAVKKLWYATVTCDALSEWRQQVCGVVAGESVPMPRVDYAATLWDDILLVFGGVLPDTGIPVARLELLHLGTHCWTHGSTTGTLPAARSGLTIAVDQVGARMVVFGGWDGAQHLSDIHVLDLQTWHWEFANLTGPGPGPRRNHAACAWEGGMAIHGGSSDQGEFSDLWLLHWEGPPSNWWWERLDGNSITPKARANHAAVAVGDCILIAGGQLEGASLVDAYLFHLRSREWQILPSLPHGIASRQSLTMLNAGVAILAKCANAAHGCDLYLLPHHILWNATRQDLVSVEKQATSEKQTTGNRFSWDASQPLSLQDVKDRAAAGDEKASKALANIEKLAEEKKPQACWAMLHRMANMSGHEQYVDPATGYSVFTSNFLRKRPCCGNGCRHCPFGHINVPKAGVAAVAQDW